MHTNRLVLSLGVLLLIGSLWLPGEPFDFQLYDTYYIIGWATVARAIGLACILSGGVAFVIARKRTRHL